MSSRLVELALLFLKQGTIGFGGPAVHIAMMEEQVVKQRCWMTRQQFLDLVGATNLIPGPNSTEMTMHIGMHRAGFLGLLVAGVSFIVPAVLITGAMAWAYVNYGHLPNVQPMLAGIKPAVLAVIVSAGWRLGQKAFRTRTLLAVGLLTAIASLLGSVTGASEIMTLLLGSMAGFLLLCLQRPGRPAAGVAGLLALGAASVARLGRAATTATAPIVATVAAAAAPAVCSATVWKLGLVFLKIGAVLYGGGYVLTAYLHGELIGHFDFTDRQLSDAIAIGQFTPGPILSTATFVGYVIAGWPGAVVATLGIFTPSFFAVALLHRWVPRLRKSIWTSRGLDAVNAASIGLLIAVSVKLTDGVLVDWAALRPLAWSNWLIAVASGVALFRWKISAAWLILAGALLGWLFHFM